MFLGHFAVAFAAKKTDRTVSLGTTILAAQWLDLLWPVLLLTGTEQAALAPPNAAVPLEFTSYPVSHSLLAVVAWAILFAIVFYSITKNTKGSWLVGLLVISHWLLDFLVHIPDLPITPFSDYKTGLGLWNYKMAELVLELLMFAAGVYLFFQNRTYISKKKDMISWSMVIFLVIVHIMNTFGSAPPSIKAVAVVGLSQWLLVGWGYWADPARRLAPRLAA
jgi:membrane-bound metal-dependent hydrolase YbcI (DUF457 family)